MAPVKIVTVVGARPQFVKAAVVSQALAEFGAHEVLVHTGQHHDAGMSDVFFDELDLPDPAHYLGISGGSHGRMTGRMLEAIEAVLQGEQPDWCLVYGDTNSTLAGALAAVKLHVPLAHIEAGLRSWNRRMPEEVNRVLTDHAADVLLAPTQNAVTNLTLEGLADRCHNVGDVMYDAALHFGERAAMRNTLRQLCLERGAFVLATVHRAENTDCPGRLAAIANALIEVSAQLRVVLPLHPRTREALVRGGLMARLEQSVLVVHPVGFLDMMLLQQSAALIATDSGGVQKEAFFFGVPCVTLRDETEWVELVDLGWNTLASPNDAALASVILSRIGSSGRNAQPYGDGSASRAIARVLNTNE
jgi:UDP-GlcNAc3NAcA epimerase